MKTYNVVIPNSPYGYFEGLGVEFRIARWADFQIASTSFEKFANGEEYCCVDPRMGMIDSHKSFDHTADTFIVYSFECTPHDKAPNSIFSLFLLLDAVKRACTGKIYIIAPYLPYSRQDRAIHRFKDKDSVFLPPISAAVVADGLRKVDAIFTMDIHSEQAAGFYNCPVINISSAELFAEAVKQRYDDEGLKELVVVSPDAGGAKRANIFANKLGMPIEVIIAEKTRSNGETKISIPDKARGKTCIIIDDILDGGGTLISAANELKHMGAKEVIACITHPILSGDCRKIVNESVSLSKIYVFNSIPDILYKKHDPSNMERLNISKLIIDEVKKFLGW